MKTIASLLTIKGLVSTYGKMWSNGVKTAFFSKNYQKSPSCLGLRPQAPVNDTFELQYTSLLSTFPNLDIFTF